MKPTLFLCLILLCGCGTPNPTASKPTPEKSIYARITVFHELPPNLKGKQFLILDREQQYDIRFKTYASHLAGVLESRGLIRTTESRNADFLVFFAFEPMATRTFSTSRPVYRSSGGTRFVSGYSGGEFFQGTINEPYRRDIIGERQVQHEVNGWRGSVEIYDAPKAFKEEVSARIYRSEFAIWGLRYLPETDAFPKLTQVVGREFPGQNGSTDTFILDEIKPHVISVQGNPTAAVTPTSGAFDDLIPAKAISQKTP